MNFLQFDTGDRDRLASCLPLFGQLGKISAPECLQIRPFSPIFYFDKEKDGRIRLDIEFDYGDIQVTSRQQLEELPFASDAAVESQIFQVSLGAGFEADFQSWRQALKPEAVYSFFHHTIPAFEKLGQVFLSDEINQLFKLLRFRSSPKEDCWKSSLTSKGLGKKRLIKLLKP